ncbi:MAG: hypothetical protein ACHBMF_03695 [Chromatiales bacterium]
MYGFEPYGTLAYGASSRIGAVLDPPEFIGFIESPVVDQSYIASFFVLPQIVEEITNDGPYGGAAYGANPYGGANTEVSAGLTEIGYSTMGYTSHLEDTPANMHWEARLRQPITFARGIETSEHLAGLTELSGDIEVENGDGALDNFLEHYAVDGREVRVRAGPQSAPLEHFGDIFSGRIVRAEALLERFIIGVSDGLANLQGPLQSAFYAGTGGLEGGFNLKGKPKPLCFGYVFNVSPPLVDAVNLIYQVHAGRIRDVPMVYDRGVALTRVAGGPGMGQYSVDLINGTFRLGAPAAGTCTADVEGDALPDFAAGTADIILRLLMVYGRLTDSEIEPSSFSLSGYARSDVGYFIGVEPTALAEVMAELLEGIGGYAGFNRFGRFEIGVLSEPRENPVMALTAENIIQFERLPLPAGLNPVVWRVTCGYKKNWTVQDDLAASVPAARVQFAAQEYRIAEAADSGIKSRHLLAQEMNIASLFRLETDAQGETLRRFELFSRPRYLYRIVSTPAAIRCAIGQCVNVIMPRYGLDRGALGSLVGSRFDAARGECELTVFI